LFQAILTVLSQPLAADNIWGVALRGEGAAEAPTVHMCRTPGEGKVIFPMSDQLTEAVRAALRRVTDPAPAWT
jgi:hypothetical protein